MSVLFMARPHSHATVKVTQMPQSAQLMIAEIYTGVAVDPAHQTVTIYAGTKRWIFSASGFTEVT